MQIQTLKTLLYRGKLIKFSEFVEECFPVFKFCNIQNETEYVYRGGFSSSERCFLRRGIRSISLSRFSSEGKARKQSPRGDFTANEIKR